MVIKETVQISIYDNIERTLHIYIPDHLQENERCGVIYMYDGHNLFFDEDATYGKSWGLKDFFDATGFKVIIVGLECNHEGNMRLCEFSPYDFSDEEWGDVKASGKELTYWIMNELKPMIDANYPTLPDRDHTAIGGSSMGGLMSIYGGVVGSKVFSKAICISPYHSHLMGRLLRDCRRKIEPNTKFYMSWGSNECGSKKALATYSESNLKIMRALQGKAEVYPHIYLNHDHSEACWESETMVWVKELGINQW